MLLLSACDKTAAPPPPPAAESVTVASAIDWRQGDVQDAFAEAAESGKPILLYWGAVWCPPCNRLKATLFKDPEFIARTRQFVAVHLDGDSEGAQAWGERFGIKGYPTIVLLRADRSEITRLAGDSDIDRLSDVLRVAAGSRRSAAELLQLALQQPDQLDGDDWSVLGEYGWSVDGERLVKREAAAEVLQQLARAAPQPALQRRFALTALLLSARSQAPDSAPSASAQAANYSLLQQLLAEPAEVRSNRAALSYSAALLVRAAASEPAQRQQLANALLQALDKVYADPGLPISDRLATTLATIQLVRLDRAEDAALPAAVIETVRQRVHWAEQAASSDYERQSTLSSAAYLLAQCAERDAAERLLLAELKRSKTPYYYMPELAKYAEARGDRPAALAWLQQGYQSAEGPATRVQWGVLYVNGLLRLAPTDKAGIEAATVQVIGELAGQPQGYHQRTRQRLESLGTALQAWSRAHDGAQVLARLRQQMQRDCGDACAGWAS